MRRTGGPLLLASAAFALALLAAESIARIGWAPPRYHNEPLRFDTRLGFAGIPGRHANGFSSEDPEPHVVVLNREGFRGPLLPDGPPSDADTEPRRIAFVGDSFVVGAGVDESELMSTRVADALSADGAPVRAWNLAAADYGTGQELMLLRELGPRLGPSLVVLVVYPHNDLINNFEGLAFRTQVSPGDYLRPYVVPRDGALEVRHAHPVRALLRHSRLYALLERRLVAWGAQRDVRWLHPFEHPLPPLERIAQGQAPYAHQELFRQRPPSDDGSDDVWEQAWERTAVLLEAFRDTCDALNAQLLVVVVPDLHQVQRVASDVAMDLRIRQQSGQPLDHYLDWNLPERRLSQLLRERSIDTVLLLPRLRGAVAAGETVYLRDRHLNARGHALAAEAIVEALNGGAAADPVAELRLHPRPVPLPGPDRAPRRIQPAASEHWPYRSGWLSLRPQPGSPMVGAMPLQEALVALPTHGNGRHELVVDGIAAARHYPLEVSLELVSGPRQQFRIEQPGPFVLRTQLPLGRVPRSDGYVALQLSALDAQADEASGLIVREVGFDLP